MRFITALPWNFVIVASLIGLHQTHTPVNDLIEKGLFILYLCALIFGFVNSSNISHHNFTLLIIRSIASVAIASGFSSYLWWGTEEGLSFIYAIGLAIVMVNAVISPINSFKTALRDFHAPE
ncbi:MAG: hypothetical protein KAH08_03330 [Methylococcales bacterium]|nr:hypothetical protein [Methylococcales bacterium]